jgi:hypothetical protein
MCVYASIAQAETSANDTLATLRGPHADIATVYENGVLNAFNTANAMAVISGGHPL